MEHHLNLTISSLDSVCTRVTSAEKEELRSPFAKGLDVDLRGGGPEPATEATRVNSKIHLDHNLCLELADFLKICAWVLADFAGKLSAEVRNKISQLHPHPDNMFKELYRVAHRAHILVERCFEEKWLQMLFKQACTSHSKDALDVIEDLQWCIAQIWKIAHLQEQPSEGFHRYKEVLKGCDELARSQKLWEKLKNYILLPEQPSQVLHHFKKSFKECEGLDQRQLWEKLRSVEEHAVLVPLTQNDVMLSRFLLERIRVQVNPSSPSDLKASLDYTKVSGTCRGCTIQGSSKGNSELKFKGKGAAGSVIVTDFLSIRCARKDEEIYTDVALQEFTKRGLKLSKLSHPHVIKLFGFFHEKSLDGASYKGYSLMELMKGSLYDEMKVGCAGDKKKPLQYPVAVDTMIQIARGVRYLHENDVAHRDLKCENILVNDHNDDQDNFCSLPGELTNTGYKDYFHIKIADFDQAEFFISSNSQQQHGNLGTTGWRAPEACAKPGSTVNVHPKRADSYSFAMTCYELLSVEMSPLKALRELEPRKTIAEISNDILDGKRPLLPEDCPILLKDLIFACWEKEALKRPDFDEICRRLQDVRSVLLTGTLSQRNRLGDAESSASLKQPSGVGSLRVISSICKGLMSIMRTPLVHYGITKAALQVTKDGVFPKQKHDILTTKVIVGLDFGTTHSGVAYAKVSNRNEIYQISWPSINEGDVNHYKTPTGMFYKQTPNGDWAWEYPACEESARGSHFRRDGYSRELKQSLTNSGRGCVDHQPVTDYLQNLGNFVLSYLRLHEYPQESLSMDHLRWCVTVPSNWSMDSKERFHTCLVKAGLVQGQAEDETCFSTFDMFRESDASAQHCYTYSSQANLDRICVLDVGSENVQCVFEDWNNAGRARSIYDASNSWPGRGTIRSRKRKYEDNTLADIRNLDNSTGTADHCDLNHTEFRNHPCFSSSHTEFTLVENVVSFLQERLQKTESNVKRLFVVGGYATHDFFMREIKKSFPNVRIKSPPNPGLAVCEGAVSLGFIHLDSQVKARTQQDSSSNSEGGGEDTNLDGGTRDADIYQRGRPGSSQNIDPSIPRSSGDENSKGKEKVSAEDHLDVDFVTEKMLVALDFGTSQISFAYALASSPSSEITVCKDSQRRIPNLYYELHHDTLRFRSWGQKAKDDYRDSVQTMGEYVSKPKLHVAVDNIEPELNLYFPERLVIDDVISDCLREYGQFILEQLPKKCDKNFEFHHIQWCLLVPSFWGENAKLRMKACMIKAGLLRGASNEEYGSPYPLVTVLEAEAAAIACVRSISLSKGDKFLLASIGCGTMDMVTEERIGDADTYEMLEASMGGGGFCGSSCLDSNFLALLSMKMGAWISEYLKQNPCELNDLMSQWEQIKAAFSDDCEVDEGCMLHFPMTIQDAWANFGRTSASGQLRESYESLKLSTVDVKMVFEPIVQTILELIASQLDRSENVNALVLAGGFAKSPYLSRHIEHRFRDQIKPLGMVRLADSESAVLKGAVSFALHPKGIRSRIARKTYGLGMSMNFQAGRCSAEEESNGVERFRIDVERGSHLEVDYCVESVHEPLKLGQENMKFSLYSSVESYPRFTYEESVIKEWDFVVDISDHVDLKKKPQIRIALYYGRSAIEVEARAVNFGEGKLLPVRFEVGTVRERNTMVPSVARKTYGIGAHRSLAQWDLPKYVKLVDEENLCNFSFETYIQKGTRLDYFASRTIFPIHPKQQYVLFKLFSSSETSPVYITDDSVLEEGTLEIDITKGLYLDMNRKVSVRMWFSRTDIKISSVALNFSKPEDRNLPIRLLNGKWESQVTLNLARHLRVVPLQPDFRAPIVPMDEDRREEDKRNEDISMANDSISRIAPFCQQIEDAREEEQKMSTIATCLDEGHRTEDGTIQEKRPLYSPPDGILENFKRARAPNWTDKETKALLKSKLDVLMRARITGKRATSWSREVSQRLFEKNGCERSFQSCQQRWDTVFKDFVAIREHNSEIDMGGSNCIHFWEMNADQRSMYAKLPRVFSWEWYKLMESIALLKADCKDLENQNREPTWRTRSTQVDPNVAPLSTQSASTAVNPFCSTARTASTITQLANSPQGPSAAIRSQPPSFYYWDSIDHLQAVSTQLDRKQGQDKVLVKRSRGHNWEDEEKTTLLAGRLKVLLWSMLHSVGESTFKDNQHWFHYVSEHTGRTAISCQAQWDTLVKSRNSIDDHESKIKAGVSSHVSFWQMDEHQKNIINEERRSSKLGPLPRAFQRAWYELIDMIFQITAMKGNLVSNIVLQGENRPS